MKLFEELFNREPLPLFLAPMEAVTDAPFRKICKRFGAKAGFCDTKDAFF